MLHYICRATCEIKTFADARRLRWRNANILLESKGEVGASPSPTPQSSEQMLHHFRSNEC